MRRIKNQTSIKMSYESLSGSVYDILIDACDVENESFAFLHTHTVISQGPDELANYECNSYTDVGQAVNNALNDIDQNFDCMTDDELYM